jgi:hypothetical protein
MALFLRDTDMIIVSWFDYSTQTPYAELFTGDERFGEPTVEEAEQWAESEHSNNCWYVAAYPDDESVGRAVESAKRLIAFAGINCIREKK